MKAIDALSQRGREAYGNVLRVDFEVFFEAMSNLYHRKDNPKGTFPLNTAENKLSWSMLKEKLELVSSEKSIPPWVSGYTSCLGNDFFREAMAGFLEQFLTHCPVHPDQLGVSSGATATIEMTTWVLGNPGDVAVFPAPCYPVYSKDIGNKAGVERYDLITHHELSEIKEKPTLSIKHLKKARKDIEKAGKTFKLLVLTTPDNPTGTIYSKKKLTKIANWCIDNHIHLIVNEVYGLSLVDTTHPAIKEDYKKQRTFTSFTQIMRKQQSPYLHLWYALSKDLGISGFRIGLVHSYNEAFIKAYDNLNAPYLVSNHTQWLISMILSDHHFMREYIEYNQKKLTEAYVLVIKYLKNLQIPYVPARGSLFIWADFSEFLVQNSQRAETRFWEKLYRKTGILLTPGEGFGHTKRGLFRIVYSCFDVPDLTVAMERLNQFVQKARAEER
ncbi:MAG: aminotransferase class I/II-fold pyridoxal phosphate-dependent enzyme [Bacteroidota bacterium]